MADYSPMMKQYFKIKEENPDCILFFRLGDFYEMFFEDAKIASEELDLVLTGRDCGLKERAPMCGVPYHSCESYIARLISKGYRVAICEQVEDPAKAKGLVKREITGVITPGTVIDDSMLDEARNNYLASIYYKEKRCGFCLVDASTGLLHLTELGGDDVDQRVIGEMGRFSPRELIATNELENHTELAVFLASKLNCRFTNRESRCFSDAVAKDIILSHFGVKSLEELKLKTDSPAVNALGAALDYLYETRKTGLEAISSINFYTDEQYMRLDISAMRNLELCESMGGNGKKYSLLWVLDKTRTVLGKRRLFGMVEQPLVKRTGIESRQNAVEELISSVEKRGEIREMLLGIKDIERIMSRVDYGTAGARDLNLLAETFEILPRLHKILDDSQSRLIKGIYSDIDELTDVKELIKKTISDDPAALVREGGIIRDGFSKELDELRVDLKSGKGFLSRIENEEREKTGIKAIKVRYNKVFGYYIEVPNSFKGQVPENYIRKQTLTNCERYITDELKTLEGRILGARERINKMEYDIFEELRSFVSSQRARIFLTADAVARLDAFASLAEVAAANGYVRPQLNEEGRIKITDGRHPVIERINRLQFVPNDTSLDINENRCMIITGPNMAGKSTYMRQVALITIMAQIGSFVPAKSADISICDAVYTRVGASDDLASGKSTFMVEMSEVAYILKNATEKSLLILDEIGRGTSTYDGMAIARAVIEHCSSKKQLGAKTLFATHYHELTVLENELEGVKNYSIAAKKRGDDIIFLRRIVRGGADESYGIEVAKLSGIPQGVIKRAKEVLKSLEEDSGKQIVKTASADSGAQELGQLSLQSEGYSQLIEKMQRIDVNTLTPIEAMQELADLVTAAKDFES